MENKNTNPFYNMTIPSDWEVKKLGLLVEIISGNSPSLFNLKNEGKYPYLKVEDLNNCEKYQKASREYSDDKRFIVPKNSVIFPKRGAAILNNKVRINTVAVQMDTNLMAIYPNSLNLDHEYLYYQITFEKLYKIADTSTIPQINNKHIAPYSLKLPPLPEQRAIAQVLSTMDTAINKHMQLIAQKELRKKWIMQNLLTGKKRLKYNGELKIENGEWITVRLRDAFEFVRSYAISRDGLHTSDSDNLIYCIHYGDIHSFYESDFLDFSEQKNIPQIINESYPMNTNDFLREGDVIIADASEDYSGVGEAVEVKNIIDKLAVGGLHTIVLRGNSEIISNGFRGYLFASERVRNTLRKFANGTSVYSVSKTTLHNLSFIIPNSLEEQTTIAKVLQTADKEIELLRTKTEKLREQKKGMMQVLLTGKKRLKVD